MYNYDNRDLVLALCQLNGYKHCDDVSHVHVSRTEEPFTMYLLQVSGSQLSCSPADHLRVMCGRIWTLLETPHTNQFIYAVLRNHLAWLELKVILAGHLPDWHLIELVGGQLHSPSLLSSDYPGSSSRCSSLKLRRDEQKTPSGSIYLKSLSQH